VLVKILCVFGKHQYGDPSRGFGVEYVSFIPALKKLGHEVHHFDSWNRATYADLAQLNARLLETVEALQPEVMLVVHMEYEVWIETLEIISARGDVATVSWAADDSWKYREVSRFVGRAYHAMTTTFKPAVAQYREDGISRILLTQWGVPDEWVSEPLPSAECKYEVSFVGAAHGNRLAWVDRLRANGIEVACFGHGWPAGSVSAESIPQIMRRSIISLNFANSKGVNQIKARTFEVPGCGGFLMTECAPGLEDFYRPGREIEVFQDLAELVAKIRYYLSHPEERDEIAWAGFSRTRSEHRYSDRMRTVLEHALQAREAASGEIAAKPFAQALASHRLSLPLKAVRNVTLRAGCLIFGPTRGLRAARRLVFELSWRLVGRHTFTAAGWPGRMFPEC
jgi:spore maturation protein CgeB